MDEQKMSAAIIAQLIIALGPVGLQVAQQLAAVWTKPALSVDEVVGICAPAAKAYETYIAEARQIVTR